MSNVAGCRMTSSYQQLNDASQSPSDIVLLSNVTIKVKLGYIIVRSKA